MAAAAALLAATLLALTSATATAGLLEPADATELAQALAEAQAEQDICYGWQVDNNFAATDDVGSSIGGPGARLLDVTGSCRGYVVLTGSINYTCDACEASDSATISINSNLPRPPTVDDLERLGYDAGDLLGGDDDLALCNMVNALPLLTAEKGNAPFVPVETPRTVPAVDRATNHPGSDFWRTAWPGLLLFTFLVLAGALWWLYKRSELRSRPAP